MDTGILFVSPYPQDATSLAHLLGENALPVKHADSLHDAESKLRGNRFRVVLTEAQLADGTWRDVLDLARKLPHPVEVVVTHPWADAGFWAEAINIGAYDLLAQPFERMEVRRVLSGACGAPSLRSSVALP
jgi:DNA-binding NtrC family response regulator